MAKRQTQGKCMLCDQALGKAAMARHLAKCVEQHPLSGTGLAKSKLKQGRLFHLVAEGRHSPEYWIHLEVPARRLLADLDAFLRRIWLECCGHMSAFSIEGRRYSIYPMDELEEQDMQVELGEVLRPGMKFFHEYDFGSTTELAAKVVSEYEGTESPKLPVRLLARNDAPSIPCGVCGAPATTIDMEQSWEPTGWLCTKCAKKRGVEEEMCLPVVNSPRVGVCAYGAT